MESSYSGTEWTCHSGINKADSKNTLTCLSSYTLSSICLPLNVKCWEQTLGHLYTIINSTTGKYCSEAFISFEWRHLKISSTDSKVRTTLYSIIKRTIWKYCSVLSFHVNGHKSGFHPQTHEYSILNSTTGKHCAVAFIGMVTLHVRTTLYNTAYTCINSTTGKYCYAFKLWRSQ